MKKIIFLIVSIYNLNISGYGQEWIRIYGQGLNAVGMYVIEDYDRGFDILGMVNNYKYAWLIKTDVNGNILWDKRFGNGQYDIGSSNIEQTNDGGYILCGTMEKYGSADAYIIKLNACAEIEWCKVLRTPKNYDIAVRVKQTFEGDFVMLGAYFVTNPYSNVSLFKFNSSGDFIWHQFYPLDSLYYDDQPADLLVDTNGYLVTTSRYYPESGTSWPAPVRHNFIKTDTAGNQLWNLVYGTGIHFCGWPWAVKKNNMGNYYEAGNQLVATGHAAAFVKVLNDGTQSYNSTLISGTTSGGLSSIDFLNDTLLIMAGGWTLNDTTHDAFFRTDTLGNHLKTKELPRVTNSFISTAKSIDNKFITVGNDAPDGILKIIAVKINSDLEYDSIYTTPYKYDSLCPHPIVSDTVDPDCENVYVDIEEPFTNPETTKLKVFPNPSSDKVTIEMPKYLVLNNTTSKILSTTIYHQWKSVMLEVYAITGKKVMEREINRSVTMLVLDVSVWGKGIYAFRLVYQKQEVGNALVVVQ